MDFRHGRLGLDEITAIARVGAVIKIPEPSTLQSMLNVVPVRIRVLDLRRPF